MEADAVEAAAARVLAFGRQQLARRPECSNIASPVEPPPLDAPVGALPAGAAPAVPRAAAGVGAATGCPNFA